MFTLLRRVGGRINRHAGLGLRRTYLYRILKSDRPPGCTLNNIPGLELLSPARVGRLLDIGPFELANGNQRLQRGDRCYTVDVEGRLAHYSWVQFSGTHPITEAGLSTDVRDGEFWIYDCRTVEWARGKRIYPSVLERIVAEQFEAGYHTAWIYTSQDNIASQKGILRAGFRPVSALVALRAGTHYRRIGQQLQGQ